MIEFLKNIPLIARVIERILALFSKHQDGEWKCDVEQAEDDLEKAKNANEKIEAAQDIVNSIRSLE